ncbi:uncharacterized protein LODBEIA_P49720 [Lodderomyces beijingensis]|uniref:NADP-dependent oxidoreductase domain-containing protein n=1 Tax=Lodderomyces beijingensis TaxID=1775926 RepID=A0ABP0ZRF7_9ASCO
MASEVKQPYSIANLPPLIIGGAVFNHQYSSDPHSLPVESVLARAFKLGFNAIDTSPYYGPSEEILGAALSKLPFPRDSYYICTKAGRVKLDEFDYSRSNVRASVLRSLQRLGTTYLDLVYMHDIEFQAEEQILSALDELKSMKSEGLIRNYGVSGYPVAFLFDIALKWRSRSGEPLDAVLSYCHGCIQNVTLLECFDRFKKEAGVAAVMNGSILSMSMLRSVKPHAFHPAGAQLKSRVLELATQMKEEDNVELAELATKFAIYEWIVTLKSSLVLGVSNLQELDVAVSAYNEVRANGLSDRDRALIERFQSGLGDHFNETWASGFH